MTEHRDTVKTEAECESRELFRIDAAVLEHVRIDRAAAADFHPARALATTATLATAEHAAHVHFCGRFREREEARTEASLDACTKEFVHEHLEHALEVGEANVFVNDKTFALLEHRSVCCIVIDAEHVARSNHAERRLVRFHVVNLGARCVRAEHDLVVHVERVLHVAARMVRRSVERFKVVPIRFDVATEVHIKTHLRKEVDDFFADVVQRVRRTGGDAGTRERDIDSAASEFLLEGCFVCCFDSLVNRFGNGNLQFVHELAVSGAFFGAERTHLLHEVGDGAFLAEVLYAEIVDRFLIGEVRLCKFCIKGLLDIVNSFTHSAAKFRKIADSLHEFRLKNRLLPQLSFPSMSVMSASEQASPYMSRITDMLRNYISSLQISPSAAWRSNIVSGFRL